MKMLKKKYLEMSVDCQEQPPCKSPPCHCCLSGRGHVDPIFVLLQSSHSSLCIQHLPQLHYRHHLPCHCCPSGRRSFSANLEQTQEENPAAQRLSLGEVQANCRGVPLENKGGLGELGRKPCKGGEVESKAGGRWMKMSN